MADLASYLTEAWDHNVAPARHVAPGVDECAADVPTDALRAKRKELQAVAQRCYVSSIHLAFIDRVLASLG